MSRKKKDRSKELLEDEERFRKKWNEDMKKEGTKAWQLWEQTKKWIEEGNGVIE